MLLRVNLPCRNSPGRQALGLDPLRLQAKSRAHFQCQLHQKRRKEKSLQKMQFQRSTKQNKVACEPFQAGLKFQPEHTGAQVRYFSCHRSAAPVRFFNTGAERSGCLPRPSFTAFFRV